ncbi:MAG: hypothetical protein ABJC05_03920 [Pyrinomonadaceae bacterium]
MIHHTGLEARSRRIVLPIAIGCVLLTSACGNSLYKVKPVIELPPLPATARATNLGGLTLRAAPLVLDEESQELFEANLPLSGLLPVRVEMVHNSGETIELKRVHFRLHDGAGNEWKTVSAKQAIGLILKANQVYAYNPQSRKTFEKEFRAYEFDLKSPLTHAERQRSGFIIFQSPKKSPVASPHGLVLSIEGLRQPATLTLN